jgi:hypothetical protein
MPTCIGLTHGQIWQLFLQSYGSDLREQDLREIHNRWIRIASESGVRRKK